MPKNKAAQKKRKLERLMQKHLMEDFDFKTSEDAIFSKLSNMTHRDMQKASVLKGIEFESVLSFDHHKLIDWLYKNWDNTENINRLIEYDAWFDNQLTQANGIITIRHSSLRFADATPIENLHNSPPQLNKPVAKSKEDKKPSKTKNEEWGINTGTKKYLTYELTINDKKNLVDIIEEVKAQFPDAEDSSIKIWYKRALKFTK